MMRVESGGEKDPTKAVSPKGAIGPMQLMPGTAKDLGVDPNDWKQNIDGGLRYLGNNIKRFGSVPLGVAAYHAGPGAVSKPGNRPKPALDKLNCAGKLSEAHRHRANALRGSA
jgi:soluble lytic murein transglycosylase-like protein